MASQRDGLRVGAAVLGAVAVALYRGAHHRPPRPCVMDAQPDAPPARFPPAAHPGGSLGGPARVEVGHGGMPLGVRRRPGVGRPGGAARSCGVDPRATWVVVALPAEGESGHVLAVWRSERDDLGGASERDQVVRLDPGTGRVACRDQARLAAVPGRGRGSPTAVAGGGRRGCRMGCRRSRCGRRIDLASNRVVATIKLLLGVAGIAVAGGSVWVAAGGDGVADRGGHQPAARAHSARSPRRAGGGRRRGDLVGGPARRADC